MAAKIFDLPKGVKVPELNWDKCKNVNDVVSKYESECKQFRIDLKTKLIELGFKGKNVGETIEFPVADGSAEYMIASMRPLQIVHLPLGDAWEFRYAHLLTAKEVQSNIDFQKEMEKMCK